MAGYRLKFAPEATVLCQYRDPMKFWKNFED